VVGAAAKAVKPERTAKISLVTKTELHGQKSMLAFDGFYAFSNNKEQNILPGEIKPRSGFDICKIVSEEQTFRSYFIRPPKNAILDTFSVEYIDKILTFIMPNKYYYKSMFHDESNGTYLV
jgi:hypothetical protein